MLMLLLLVDSKVIKTSIEAYKYYQRNVYLDTISREIGKYMKELFKENINTTCIDFYVYLELEAIIMALNK